MTSASAQRAPRPPVAAEVTLTLLTAAAVLGLARLFSDGAPLPRILAAGLAAHVLSAGLRRRDVPPLLSGLALAAGGIAAVSWLIVPGTTFVGFPTPETLAVVIGHLRDSWEVFGAELAPVAPLPGFVIASIVATWGLAVLADVAAFRLHARFESVVPSLTMFAFAATLGAPRHRVLATAVYGVALLAHLAVHHAASRERDVHWLTDDTSSVHGSVARRALVAGALALTVAVGLGPHLPGVDADAVVAWRDLTNDGPDNRVTVSPLVDIRGRLVSQSDLEVFTVRSDQRAYWRLTSLDTFDGRIWSAVASYRPAAGDLSTERHQQRPTELVEQTFEIFALSTVWLPVAYEPVAITSSDAELRYDADSGSVISSQSTGTGLTYDVTSALPSFQPQVLRALPSASDIDPRYRSLPSDFSQRAAQLARELTAASQTPYEAALALQDFFRQQFTYSLDVAAGHSSDDIESFLFGDRVGYCEQFAGSYAALARSLGLPARVAVGFTPGELGDDGLYHVRGEHAHAWPEVWIDGAGWVAFEPTPGRGAPGAEGYTGVPEQQAAAGDPTTATTLPPVEGDDPVPTTAPDGTSSDGVVAGGTTPDPADDAAPETSDSPGRTLLGIALGAVVVLAAAVGASALRNRRRLLARRRRATEPAAEVSVAWAEAVEALLRVDAGPLPGETIDELAARSTHGREAMTTLAEVTQTATYGPSDPAAGDVLVARRAATEVIDDVRRSVPARRRVLWAIDPRVPRGR